MTKLTVKEVLFVWSPECEVSFASLKQMLTTTPVLALLEQNENYVVFTDASGVGLGCVLMQQRKVTEVFWVSLRQFRGDLDRRIDVRVPGVRVCRRGIDRHLVASINTMSCKHRSTPM
ncbi:PREDICTED: uncharacterized protein LOC109128680 [Camelina sativa]|uniref:Uncharacterized protein LOC109128680 n=1 Tax=Camelina sativa TaxID=90675 RepID=A0ABM1QWD0_CAMSA|nr:PREDICTED: uncharacterized protein LOC109128680 [Camelina sativa]